MSAYQDMLDQDAERDELDQELEREDRRREKGPATDADRALAARAAERTMFGALLVGIGAVLALSQVCTTRPWQAVFAVGLGFLIVGGTLIADAAR